MTSKKIIIPLIILVILVGYLLYLNSSSSSNNQPFSDFEIADTTSISKITLSRTTGESVTLERNNDNKIWMIEGTEFEANISSLNLLMKTFAQWKVLQDIEPEKQDFVIRLLSSKHTKIQLYNDGDNKPFKTIYIGDHNPSMTGNFALLQKGNKKSSVPYLINLPGFYGTLETRFFADPVLWRSTRIIELEARDIAQVKLKNFQNPQESYSFSINGDVFDLKNGDEKTINKFDTLSLRRHLVAFKQLHYEGLVNNMKPTKKDSLLSSTPLYELTVTTTKNLTKKVTVFCKNPPVEKMDANNQPLKCDPDRLYALVDDKELFVIQTFGWGNVFKPLSYFTEP
jgi:hypothetical protein